MSAATEASGSGSEEPGAPPNPEEQNHFDCNICLDTAKDAVVSMCGHLFCWPCLYQWLETRPNVKTCPVCKAGISRDKVIPVYGRDSDGKDPRNKLPPRPSGQRSEPENSSNFPGFGMAEGFQMSFGIGAFPFGFIGSTFNLNDGRGTHRRPPAPAAGSQQSIEEQFLSKIFVWVAILFIFWLVIA